MGTGGSLYVPSNIPSAKENLNSNLAQRVMLHPPQGLINTPDPKMRGNCSHCVVQVILFDGFLMVTHAFVQPTYIYIYIYTYSPPLPPAPHPHK